MCRSLVLNLPMRRFSQRNSLVTLSEINITPLLDLAFVLLIIFVIISPSIKSQQDHGMELDLPQGGGPAPKVDPRNRRVVEIDRDGAMMLDRQRMVPERIEQELVNTFRRNPNLVVQIRGDGMGRIADFMDIVDRCQRNGIFKFQIDTQTRKN